MLSADVPMLLIHFWDDDDDDACNDVDVHVHVDVLPVYCVMMIPVLLWRIERAWASLLAIMKVHNINGNTLTRKDEDVIF